MKQTMKTFLPILIGILPFLFVILTLSPRTTSKEVTRSIQVLNESGRRVEINWIHPDTGELVLQSTPFLYNGASMVLNSFVGHRFEVRELPGVKSGVCGDPDSQDESCRVGYFMVNDNYDQVVFFRKGMQVEHVDNVAIARKDAVYLLEECEEMALQDLSASPSITAERSASVINNLMKCVSSSVTEKLKKANEEVQFQAEIRQTMAHMLENYTCADESLNTTEAVKNETWFYKGKARKVAVLHEGKASKIHLIRDFISEEECDAVETAAKKLLHRATVANSDGGSRLHESRKAMQAGVKVPWREEAQGNPIAVLSRRVFDYTNRATGFDLEEFGQEEIMSIQYTGRGEDDEAPDRYMPHCDGDCTGLPHKDGQRVATVVMYCTVPEKGGATQFMNSGVHIVPEKGAAVFFSYMGQDKIMDKGFTLHSGCPVIKGEKKIVTQWMRMGVDAENPWDSWNTLGVKYSDERLA